MKQEHSQNIYYNNNRKKNNLGFKGYVVLFCFVFFYEKGYKCLQLQVDKDYM